MPLQTDERVAGMRIGSVRRLFDTQEVLLKEIDAAVIEQATAFRAAFGLKASDAIHAATAILAGVSEFWTADRDFCGARNSRLNCSTQYKRVGSSSRSLSLPFTGQCETMATALFIGTFAVLLVLLLAANALFLQLGSRWAKISDVTFGRALWAAVAAALVGLIPIAILGCVQFIGLETAILILVSMTVPSLGLMWLIIAQFQDEFQEGNRGLAARADSRRMFVRRRAARCSRRPV